MYSDIITPKADAGKLQEVGYDPFGLMPKKLPPAPRVFLTAAQVERTKELINTCGWARQSLELLEKHCTKNADLPNDAPAEPDPGLCGRALDLGQCNVLAYLLTEEQEYKTRALHAFRLTVKLYQHGMDAQGESGKQTFGMLGLGRTFDMLAAAGLADEDDEWLRSVLSKLLGKGDGCPHHTCGNLHTWSLAGRLSLAIALGNLQGIHNALYGCMEDGRWLYGIIHQLRHDFLSDGMHWERTIGYHFYTLMGMTEIVCVLQNAGVDLWHTELPVKHQSDDQDLHRAYEPDGTKCIKAAFDAPFYQMFSNGDFSLLHDSGLANIRGVYIWGIIYNKAYEAYGDEKYAWLLNFMEREYPEREHPDLPMPLQTNKGHLDFARLGRAEYGRGRFSLAEDRTISLCGRHEQGCTLFPVHGSAVLRGNAEDGTAPSVFLFYGPHSAGHQAPAALHIDIHAGGRRVTDAPRMAGYDDPNYLTWARTTIAHNTVTVDKTPMFPYDFETESIWEADSWRDRVSDGELLLFQPEEAFKAVRAINENVYPGVQLDRTVIVTPGLVLDAFRVRSDVEHLYDWAAHCFGEIPPPGKTAVIDLGSKRGYKHFSAQKKLQQKAGPITLTWRSGQCPNRLVLLPPQESDVILARDLPPHKDGILGELDAVMERTTVIVRTRARNALFLSLWTFDQEQDASLVCVEGAADRDLVLETRIGTESTRWHLPAPDTRRTRRQLRSDPVRRFPFVRSE